MGENLSISLSSMAYNKRYVNRYDFFLDRLSFCGKKKLYNNLLPLRIEEIFLILLKCNFCFEILYIFLLISGITGKGGG